MPISYTVQKGDTLNSIAQKSGYSNYKDAGISAVPSGNFDLIRPGEVISLGNASKTMVEPNVYKVGNVYQDGTGKTINYSPIMQSTTQQDSKDQKVGAKIDALGGAVPSNTAVQGQNGNNINNGSGGAGVGADGKPNQETSYKSPDGKSNVSEKPVAGGYSYKTPVTGLQAGEKTGYGTDGKRYIIGKDGTTRNDPFADQEYQANQQEIVKTQERTALFDSLKQNLDTAHAQLLDSIHATFAVRRQKMEDLNSRYLALKQNEGFSGGQARYMSDINNGVLQDNEQQGQVRLAEIDASEKQLIAQAVQAKSEKDFELATKKMNELDQLQKEKADAIQSVYKNAIDYNKAIDEQAKAVSDAQKAQTEQGYKTLETAAPTLLAGFDQLKTPELQQTFLVNYAERLGIKPEEVSGVIEAYRSKKVKADAELQQTYAQTRASDRSNQPKKGTTTDEFGNEVTMTPEEQQKVQDTQDFFGIIDKMIAAKHKDPQGVPVVSEKGYITYKAFKDLLDDAVARGISREDFINRYQSRLNLSTLFNRAEEYGLTKAEYTKIKNANK